MIEPKKHRANDGSRSSNVKTRTMRSTAIVLVAVVAVSGLTALVFLADSGVEAQADSEATQAEMASEIAQSLQQSYPHEPLDTSVDVTLEQCTLTVRLAFHGPCPASDIPAHLARTEIIDLREVSQHTGAITSQRWDSKSALLFMLSLEVSHSLMALKATLNSMVLDNPLVLKDGTGLAELQENMVAMSELTVSELDRLGITSRTMLHECRYPPRFQPPLGAMVLPTHPNSAEELVSKLLHYRDGYCN